MKYLMFAGGVGGAKLADGFARLMRTPEDLAICVNTADDFEHLGLPICPDIDTVTYTLAGLADPERGWGLEGESWTFLDQLRRLGGEDWFMLGDRDLATHVMRRELLAGGLSLTEATMRLARALGCGTAVLPMSDDPVRTIIVTGGGELSFQHYFVRDRCEPKVNSIRFEGAGRAKPNPAVIDALGSGQLAAVIFAPSNPFVSLDPILSLPGMRDAVRKAGVPVIGVSPIVGGKAIKGPAAKMMSELGLVVAPESVARHFSDLLTDFVIDIADSGSAEALGRTGLKVHVRDTIMQGEGGRIRLAREMLRLLDGREA